MSSLSMLTNVSVLLHPLLTRWALRGLKSFMRWEVSFLPPSSLSGQLSVCPVMHWHPLWAARFQDWDKAGHLVRHGSRWCLYARTPPVPDMLSWTAPQWLGSVMNSRLTVPLAAIKHYISVTTAVQSYNRIISPMLWTYLTSHLFVILLKLVITSMSLNDKGLKRLC